MTSATEQALDQLITSFGELYRDSEGPFIDYDPEWPSDCYRGEPDSDGRICWRPTRQQRSHDLFQGLSAALETEIHPDLITYYGRYWSDPIPATYTDGDLSLLFVWNDEDYERLRGNLIGHALTKRKQKRPLTFFFACTEPEDLILSLDNSSGSVVLEEPGRPPIREVAPSLAAFLQQLTPRRI